MKKYAEEIITSTQFVVDNSKHVKISEEAVRNFAQKIDVTNIKRLDWFEKSPFTHFELSENDKVHLLLTFNALSFSYWREPYWQVTYQNITYQRGSWSLIASILRSKEEGVDISNPEIQSRMTPLELNYVLRGNSEIPLLKDRCQILNEIGGVVKHNYGCDFRNMLKEDNSLDLLNRVINSFPSFCDEAVYDGKKIMFYKRAQALVQSIAVLYNLANLDKLTALADYILPRKLRDEGILQYDSDLEKLIDNKVELFSGGNYEIELRANTIHAIEKIKFASNNDVLSKEINDYLWLTGEEEKSNHHRTRTTNY